MDSSGWIILVLVVFGVIDFIYSRKQLRRARERTSDAREQLRDQIQEVISFQLARGIKGNNVYYREAGGDTDLAVALGEWQDSAEAQRTYGTPVMRTYDNDGNIEIDVIAPRRDEAEPYLITRVWIGEEGDVSYQRDDDEGMTSVPRRDLVAFGEQIRLEMSSYIIAEHALSVD